MYDGNPTFPLRPLNGLSAAVFEVRMVRVASWFTISAVLVGVTTALWLFTLPIDQFRQLGVSWDRGALSGYTVRRFGTWQATASGYTLFPDSDKPPWLLQRVEVGECMRLSAPPIVRGGQPIYFRPKGDRSEAGNPPAAPQRRQLAPYTVVAAVGEPVVIAEESLTVEMQAVKDDRCPVEVQCIWAGHAAVTLMVSKPGLIAKAIAIGTGAPKGFNLPFEATYGSYRFTLLGLEPRNSLSTPLEQSLYCATVQVSRL